MKYLLIVAGLVMCCAAQAQVDESQTGAWYMLMWNHAPEDGSGFGVQGDIQHRNWDLGGDLEQLLIRAGITWSPADSKVQYTLGAAHITSGTFGSDNDKSREKRLYLEALVPQKAGGRIFLTHRFRLEQRDVDEQDGRNRLRYFLGVNYPLNQDSLGQGAVYLSFYNELFLNLQRDIGSGRQVDYFDRNRIYGAIGYSVSDNSRIQLGYMEQTLNDLSKGQLQLNWFVNF